MIRTLLYTSSYYTRNLLLVHIFKILDIVSTFLRIFLVLSSLDSPDCAFFGSMFEDFLSY